MKNHNEMANSYLFGAFNSFGLGQLEDYMEGSGDVCSVEGSTCPEKKCCRPEKCLKDSPNIKCCDEPSSESNCSPCKTCGKLNAIFH